MPASIIGMDIGGSNATIARVENGGVVVLNNEMSSRSTPAVVSFASGERLAGATASPHLITQPKMAVSEIRNLLGAKHITPELRKALSESDKITENGRLALDNQELFPEQVLAALMTHLKRNVVISSSDETYTVLSVPNYFTDAERAALLDAASIANVKVVDVINDLSAAALAYGYFQRELPSSISPQEQRRSRNVMAPPLTQRPRQVVFVDFGYSAIQSALVDLTSTGLRVVNVQCNRKVGGKYFDERLAQKFAHDFAARNVSKKAMKKLTISAEKAKRLMSANKNPIPVDIECLQNDADFHGSVSRQEFENLCEDLFEKVRTCLMDLVLESGLDMNDLHSVEVVGGSSRIPKFKEIIQEVFGQAAKTTLNADEAVARGAALQCAALTRVYSVKSFNIRDIATQVSVQVKHSFDAPCQERDDVDINDEDATICTESVQVAKIHKIFNKNENRFESSITLKQRPDGDTIAIEYDKCDSLEKNLIAICQLELEQGSLNDNKKIVVSFRAEQGRPFVFGCKLVTQTETKQINFKETRVGGFSQSDLQRFREFEEEMQAQDQAECQRQELKNKVEDLVYQFKDSLTTSSETFSGEEAWKVSMNYVNKLQDMIDNEESYSNWSSDKYEALLRELTEKKEVFRVWSEKFQQYLEARKQRVSDNNKREYPKHIEHHQQDAKDPSGILGYPARFMSLDDDDDDTFFSFSPMYQRRRRLRPNFSYFW